MKVFVEKVAKIQATLKAPKGQMNKFGGYKYRSCEDILEAVKPLLAEAGLILTVNDELVMAGDRFYIKATAIITDGTNTVSNSALARESEEKKGMDTAQVTGACSSYARKYALNGLLLIDDTKDADATETHGKDAPVVTPTPAAKTLNFTEKAKALSTSGTGNATTTTKAPTKSEAAIAEATGTNQPTKRGWSSSRKTTPANTATTTKTDNKGDLY